GAIVYSKAPGVLKQLAFVVGDDQFRDGLRIYLKEHTYANAEWNDLVHALERVSGKSLQNWATMWIKHRGMPQVEVEWSCDNQDKISRLALSQHDVVGEGGVWPLKTVVGLYYEKSQVPGRIIPNLWIPVQLDGAKAEITKELRTQCPDYVFANTRDYAYGRFL